MPREDENHRKKERRNRWIRWGVAMLLAGAGGLYAADRIRDSEKTIDDLSARIVGDSAAAVRAGETILALENRVIELQNVPVESIPVPGPIRWRTRIDSFPVPVEVACPVCAALDSTRIIELEIEVADLKADIIELENRPPPDPIEIRVVEVRRNWWEYVIVAGVAGGLGYVIGDAGGEESSSEFDDECKDYPDRC